MNTEDFERTIRYAGLTGNTNIVKSMKMSN